MPIFREKKITQEYLRSFKYFYLDITFTIYGEFSVAPTLVLVPPILFLDC